MVGEAIHGGAAPGDETRLDSREGRVMSLPQEMYASGSYLDKNPTWDQEDSAWKAERVREAVERDLFKLAGSAERPKVTVSIGLAIHRPEESTSALVTRADAALYASKTSGRNMVTLARAAA